MIFELVTEVQTYALPIYFDLVVSPEPACGSAQTQKHDSDNRHRHTKGQGLLDSFSHFRARHPQNEGRKRHDQDCEFIGEHHAVVRSAHDPKPYVFGKHRATPLEYPTSGESVSCLRRLGCASYIMQSDTVALTRYF